jgi:signal transduction histidine kinase
MSSNADLLRYFDLAQEADAAAHLDDEARAVLDEVNRKVAAHSSVAAIVDYLFESSASLSPCDRVSVALLSEDGHRLVSYYTRASYEPVLLKKGYAEDLQGSSLQQILDNGTPRIINDLAGYLEQHPDSRSTKLLLREGVQSNLTCPLKVDDRVVGVLFRSARVPRAYDDRQVRLHLAVAERLSQAVEKAWRIEQLSAANHAYFEMLGFVTHELKSPVASMLSSVNLMLEGYVGDVTADQERLLRRVVSNGRHLLALVREYLDLARLEGGELAIRAKTDVDFAAEVLEPSVDVVQPQIEQQSMRLEVRGAEGLPPIQCDPELLRIVLINLMSNGAKYGEAGGRIEVSMEASADAFRLTVWNDGPGFPPDQRDRLFRRFSRVQTPELLSRKGSGVGLYTCWRIVNLHGGKIDAESELGRGAAFSFRLPQPIPTEGEARHNSAQHDE